MSIIGDKEKKQIIDKGTKIYFKIKPELEKKFEANYYVTIEVKTGKYFIGKTSVEAMNKASKKFPDDMFFMAQVGRLAGRLMSL